MPTRVGSEGVMQYALESSLCHRVATRSIRKREVVQSHFIDRDILGFEKDIEVSIWVIHSGNTVINGKIIHVFEIYSIVRYRKNDDNRKKRLALKSKVAK